MKNNFDSLDNLEVQMRKSSVVQERAGLVAVYMYKQYLEFQQSNLSTSETFGEIIKNTQQVVEYLRQSFSIRNIPVQNINSDIDNTKTIALLNILWHTISFTSRFNYLPKALPRTDRTPLFCGRIFAINGNFYHITKNIDQNDQDSLLKSMLDNEIASLYIPAEKTQNAIITIKHKDNQEFYVSQVDAGREFLLKVVEIVCAGGNFHEQGIKTHF
jgi:hypothetical protein